MAVGVSRTEADTLTLNNQARLRLLTRSLTASHPDRRDDPGRRRSAPEAVLGVIVHAGGRAYGRVLFAGAALLPWAARLTSRIIDCIHVLWP